MKLYLLKWAIQNGQVETAIALVDEGVSAEKAVANISSRLPSNKLPLNKFDINKYPALTLAFIRAGEDPYVKIDGTSVLRKANSQLKEQILDLWDELHETFSEYDANSDADDNSITSDDEKTARSVPDEESLDEELRSINSPRYSGAENSVNGSGSRFGSLDSFNGVFDKSRTSGYSVALLQKTVSMRRVDTSLEI